MPPIPAASRQPWLKICGLRQPQQAAAVAALGVEAIGVIGVPGSPRWLAQAERPALWEAVATVSPATQRVLVVADPSDNDLEALRPAAGHQVVQLHGGETPERCQQLRQALGSSLMLWKALRIRSPQDLAQAQVYAPLVDALLLDAWVPDQLGGTGHRIPVDWLESFQPPIPWWLAGGMRADRVAGTLSALSGNWPDGLDASSGVERGPGDKDLTAVAALVAALAAVRQDQHS
jgi:phosphoribosylanthranilate isomerase